MKNTKLALIGVAACAVSFAQNVPAVGPNVNMVSGITLGGGDPFLTKQNESTMAVSSVNPLNIMGGSNDYRLIPLSQAGIPGETNSVDAWVGRYWSTDGGRTWRSTVVPGCPLAIPACAGNTAIQGLAFASDPTVRSGPNGTFFYSFIAGNRGTGASGVVAVQRWFDLNNATKYSADPFVPDKLNIIDNGTVGQLLDKTWNIADVSRSWNTGTTCTLPTSRTPVPAFNVYVAYSNFVGQDPTNPHPQVLVATSTDCGNTFGKPKKVSQSVATNQGTVLTIDPQNGTVYLIWRQFATPANGVPDAIYFVKSTNGGSTWTAPALVANNVPFFEQDTETGQFRAEAFATAAVSVGTDGKSRVHVAWAQSGVGPNGDGRIMLTTSSDGGATWTKPAPVDNVFQTQAAVPYAGGLGPIGWTAFNPFNPGGFGHQYQPALNAIGPKLTLIWQDQRLDHTFGLLKCLSPCSSTGHNLHDFTEVRTPLTAKSGASDSVANVFTPTISDVGLNVRHTVDVFGGQAIVGDNNPTFAATRVSQYRFGSPKVAYTTARPRLPIQQVQFNAPNLPLFAKFTLPFDGDYNDVAGQAIKATGNPAKPYDWNLDPNTVVHATWTTNQDVVTPKDGNWANATPISTLNGTTLTTNGACVPGQEGIQNQNVYTATLFNGIDAYAVVNSKYLNSSTPRQFNIVVVNGTGAQINGGVTLSIVSQPVGGTASFKPSASLLTLPNLNLRPFSSLTRTVWVTSSNPGATVTVNVSVGGTVIPVLLNPDPAGTVQNASQAPDVIVNNQSDVTIVNTPLSNAELTDNNLTDNNLTDNNLTDNNLTDAELTDNNLTDNNLTDNNLTDNNLTDNNLTDNNLTDNNLTDNNLTDNNLTDAGMVDATFTLFNNSTTDVALDVKALMRGQTIPSGYKVQLIIHKTYNSHIPDLSKRATGGSCGYSRSSQSVTVVNANSPNISPIDQSLGQTNDTGPDEYTLSLLPSEIGRVTFRLVKNGQTIDQNQAAASELGNNGVKMVGVNASSTIVPTPVVIDTLAISDATAGINYSPLTTLLASGGLAPLNWSLPGQSSTDCSPYPGASPVVPPGLALDPGTGNISGTPTTPGLYCFRVKVSDSSSPHIQTDTQLLTMIVHGTQTITFGALAGKTYGDPPFAVSATASSGLPVTFTVTGSCSISGATVTLTGAGSCNVTAHQPGNNIYFAAPDVLRTFAIAKGMPVITWANPADITYPTALSGTQLNATAGVPGAFAYTPLAGTVLKAGNAQNLHVDFVPSDTANYNNASADVKINVLKATPVITWANPADITYPTALSGTQLNATASVPGAFTYTPAAGTVLGAGNAQNLHVDFVPTDTANYSNAFADVKINVLMANQTISFTTSPPASAVYNATFPVAATATSGLPVTLGVSTPGVCSISGGTVTMVSGTGTCTVTANQPGNSNYTAAPQVTASTGALQASQTISFSTAPPTSAFFGTAFPVAATATSGLPVTLGVSTPGVCSISGGTVTMLSGTGTCTVTANQPGNSNYTAAPQVTASAAALPASQTITFGALADKVYGTPPFPVSATASSGLPVTFTATGNCTVSGNIVTITGMGSCSVTASQSGNANFSPASPVTQSFKIAAFVSTGSMGTARSFHVAALLSSGKVLVAGGLDASGKPLASAEVYDPSTGSFTATLNGMPNKEVGGTATTLPSGKVLVAGGGNASTQLYDPGANTWSSGGGMSSQRSYHTATLLANGKVLIAGGSGNNGATTNSAQLYDPNTGLFTATGNMTVSRDFHTATLLASGKVLITGGRTSSGSGYTYASSAEIYDPSTGTFTAASPMSTGRYGHTAALFNGTVLISGGSKDGGTSALATAELYDGTTGAYIGTTGSLASGRQYFTATVIGGSILAAGGQNGSTRLSSSELYQSGAFNTGATMTTARAAHTATLLNNGKVLIVGGQGSNGTSLATAELFGNP
jgi:uncharacterized protein YjbI with pentapeptide repeats